MALVTSVLDVLEGLTDASDAHSQMNSFLDG